MRRQTHWLQVIYKSLLGKAPVNSPSVNSPSNYLHHPHMVFINFFLLLFCTPVLLLAHRHLHIYHSSLNLLNCNYFATMAYLLPYLLTPFAHTVYRLSFFYCVIDYTLVYSMCNSVLLFVSHCFALTWPGRSCK